MLKPPAAAVAAAAARAAVAACWRTGRVRQSLGGVKAGLGGTSHPHPAPGGGTGGTHTLTAAVGPRAPAPEVPPLHGAEVGRLVVVTAEVIVVPPAAEVAAWGRGGGEQGEGVRVMERRYLRGAGGG